MNARDELDERDLERVVGGKNVPPTPPMPFLGGQRWGLGRMW